jgi:hypothetical protein
MTPDAVSPHSMPWDEPSRLAFYGVDPDSYGNRKRREQADTTGEHRATPDHDWAEILDTVCALRDDAAAIATKFSAQEIAAAGVVAYLTEAAGILLAARTALRLESERRIVEPSTPRGSSASTGSDQ